METPQLDKRRIGDVETQARELAVLPAYELDDWTGVEKPEDPGRRLIGLFARLMELLIERLNRVPEKNFLEFLDVVGVEPSPGNAASVPVTFVLSKKALAGGEVPAGAQVATTQTETADAQVFETRSAFFATPAKLAAVVNLVPEAEGYSVLPALELPPKSETLEADPDAPTMLNAAEATLTAVDHVLYLAQPALFARDEPVDVTLTFALTGAETGVFDQANLEWKIYSADAEDWVTIEIADPPGYVAIENTVTLTLPSFEGAAATTVGDTEAVWVACHFLSADDSSLTLPTVTGIRGAIAPPAVGGTPATERETTIQYALGNTLPLDFSKPVFPFGQRPKYGDAFYIGHDVAFGPDVESVVLRFTVRNYTNADLARIFTGIESNETVTTELSWQYLASDGVWKALPGTSTFVHGIEAQTAGAPAAAPTIVRTTTNGSDHGCLFGSDLSADVELELDIPFDIGLKNVGDVESYWLRAVTRSDDPYGKEGFLVFWSGTGPGGSDQFVFVGPTLIPPVIEAASIRYRYRANPVNVERVATLNNFELVDRSSSLLTGAGFKPFTTLTEPQTTGGQAFDADPAVYLGFDRKFGNIFVSLFLYLEEVFSAESPQLESGGPQVVWEYLAGGGTWQPLDVTDGTGHLTSSGILAFQAPLDSVAASLLPQLSIATESRSKPYWYRARLHEGTYDYPPRLRFVLLNSVAADNHETLGEILVGSGNGEPKQGLTIVQTPVLDAELWVREPERPSADEIAALEEELERLHRDAGKTGAPPSPIEERESPVEGQEKAIWVRWLRVPNFLSSLSNSRHYTLETTSGVLSFGNGDQGLIPPIAKDNILLRDLRKGGGEEANEAALPLAVKELKSSLPFIDKVFNAQAATGGSDPWSRRQIFDLGPQVIKNKERAVTTEDFEWLARTTFSQVARVRCLATRRPAAAGGLSFAPGAVTLIIVPKGTERTPQPPKSLLKQIAGDLSAKALGNIVAEVYAIAPEYQPIRVAATLNPLRPEDSSLVQRRAVRALEDFLHPLTGGEDSNGWPFGRAVYRSEIFAVLQAVEGVDYVSDADFVEYPGADSVPVGEHALVASGSHEIGVV
jgi:hypothetical protein